MATQLSGTTAVLVSETNATSYFEGGTFQLGGGPFTDLTFSASDDDTEFAALGAQFDESSGAGRQLGELSDGGGSTYDQGLASLEDVLVLTDPSTGNQITVGRVSIREDNGQPGGGAQTQDFYIFSAPIDPNVTYTITSIDYTPGSSAESSYQYSTFESGSVVCFANGTQIETEFGPCPVEHIKCGMRVQTIDSGLREVVWIGRRDVADWQLRANQKMLPVRIAPGALGNPEPLFVSQQHRILVGDAFVKAVHLCSVSRFGARLARGKRGLSYFHLLTEDHSVLFANGIGAESLFLGPISCDLVKNKTMGPGPGIAISHGAPDAGGLARPMVKKHKVAAHMRRVTEMPGSVFVHRHAQAFSRSPTRNFLCG